MTEAAAAEEVAASEAEEAAEAAAQPRLREAEVRLAPVRRRLRQLLQQLCRCDSSPCGSSRPLLPWQRLEVHSAIWAPSVRRAAMR